MTCEYRRANVASPVIREYIMVQVVAFAAKMRRNSLYFQCVPFMCCVPHVLSDARYFISLSCMMRRKDWKVRRNVDEREVRSVSGPSRIRVSEKFVKDLCALLSLAQVERFLV